MSVNELPGYSGTPWRQTVQLLSMRVAQILLPGTLYGVFVLLTLACFFILMTSKRQARTVRFLLAFALFALWASTTAFLVLNTSISQYLILQDAYITWVDPSADANTAFDNDDVLSHLRAGVCGGTATLTINIFLGDAIVWWRTCVLWRGNRPVRVLCVLLLLSTLAMGVVNTCWSCYTGESWRPDPHATGVGYMYQGFSYGVAATALSLATNVLARPPSRYRALLRKYIEVGTRISRLEKVTVLLVESGIVYCLLWIVVAILLSGLNNEGVLDSDAVMQLSSFWETFSVFLQGGLVPTIAIYPTVIIVVVALDRSQVEKRFWTTHGHQGHTETVLPVEDEYKTSVDGLRPFALAAQHHLGRAPLLAEE